MKFFKYSVYTKENGKYKFVSDHESAGASLVSDFLNFTERKLDGENIVIDRGYNYREVMEVTIYFSHQWKYVYHDIPCTSGGRTDSAKMMEED